MKTKKKTFRLRDSSIAKFIAPSGHDKRARVKMKIPAQIINATTAKALRLKLDKFIALAS